jgi:RimJ/RimL family protein N-acetyltransferase
MLLQGSRVTVRPLTRADLTNMAGWRPFANPLYDGANWPHRSPEQLDHWYARSNQDPQRLLCAVIDESGQVIGSITLRGINGRRYARLGITIGADFVDQGYGTEALILFLDYYFAQMGFQKLILDVAAFNRRALHVYEKLGFHPVKEFERTLGRGRKWNFLKDMEHQGGQSFFHRDWLGRWWMTCYDMELNREDWAERQRELIAG